MPKNPTQAAPTPADAADALGGKMIPPPAAVMTAGQTQAPAQDTKPQQTPEEIQEQIKAQRIGRVRPGVPMGAPGIPPSHRGNPRAGNPFALDATKALARQQLAEISRGLGSIIAVLAAVPVLRAQITGLDDLEGAKAIAEFEGIDLVKAAAFLDELEAARVKVLPTAAPEEV